MRRIRLIIEYDGTAYVGWQVQPNGISVQQRLNEAVYSVTGETVQLHGSGRTDSGVHALAQVAHFDTASRMPDDKFAIAMNCHLPKDIRVLYSQQAPEDFHSRFSSKEKSYRYHVQTGPHAHVFSRLTALHVHVPVDLDAMEAAACDVLGTHDFKAFMSANTNVESTVRSVFASAWRREGADLYYDITGSGFLYNMVRILAGTMLEIGQGLRGSDSIRTAIKSGLRSDAGATAPAHGLTLTRVRYEGFDTEEVLKCLR